MKLIPLSQGYSACIDDADYDAVSKFKWHAHVHRFPDGTVRLVYASRNVRLPKGKQSTLLLHRFLLDVTDSKIHVDHEDHDGLNCQRYNLRITSPIHNMQNRLHARNNTSGFKGVTYDRTKRLTTNWKAAISHNNRDYAIGRFSTPLGAALAYDAKAVEMFGEFALTNEKLGLLP